MSRLSGLIVAGGRSVRFGDREKAVAEIAGVPMIRRVADRLAPVIDGLVINCRNEQLPAIRSVLVGYDPPVRFAHEETPDCGPVAGIATGLRLISERYAVVAACDMPLIDSDVVASLFERARGHDAAVPRDADGRLQPLYAVYRPRATVAACESALEAGHRTTRAPLCDLDVDVVDFEDRHDTFENVNTPAALAAVADRFE